jgi:hypothetical protein
MGPEAPRASASVVPKEFGERFVERVAGVRVIAAAVLVAFAGVVAGSALDDRRARAWRRPHQGDQRDSDPAGDEPQRLQGGVGRCSDGAKGGAVSG